LPIPNQFQKLSKEKLNESKASNRSIGGLISLYAICEYLKVFGGAICMSTHWPGIFSVEGNPVPDAFVSYLKSRLPIPKNHKIPFVYDSSLTNLSFSPDFPIFVPSLNEPG
jgi:hypothetical protein